MNGYTDRRLVKSIRERCDVLTRRGHGPDARTLSHATSVEFLSRRVGVGQALKS